MLTKAVGDRLTESQLRGVWKMADVDGDGRLSREEVSQRGVRARWEKARFDITKGTVRHHTA